MRFKSSLLLRDMMKIERPRSSYQTEFHKRSGIKGLSKPVDPVKSAGIPLGTRQTDFMRRHKTVDRSTYRKVPPRPKTALGIRREAFPEVLQSTTIVKQSNGHKRHVMTAERGAYRYLGKMNQQRYRSKVAEKANPGFSTGPSRTSYSSERSRTDKSHYMTTNRSSFSRAKGTRRRPGYSPCIEECRPARN